MTRLMWFSGEPLAVYSTTGRLFVFPSEWARTVRVGSTLRTVYRAVRWASVVAPCARVSPPMASGLERFKVKRWCVP